MSETKKTTTKTNKTSATKKASPTKKASTAKKTSTTKKTTTKKATTKKPAEKKSATQIAAETAKKAKKTSNFKFGSKKKAKKKDASAPKLNLKDKFKNLIKRKKDKAPELVEVKKKKTNYKEERAKKAVEEWRRKMVLRSFGIVVMCLTAFGIVFGIFTMFGMTTVNAGIAACVDDYKIMEKDVTNYIEHNTYYAQYAKNKSQWGQMLNMYFGGAEKFREQAINDKFVHDELVRRAADSEGIEVSDETVDEHVASLRSKFKSEDAYKNSLSERGETPETYWQSAKQSEIEKQLKDKVSPEKTPSDDEVVSYLEQNKSTYKDAKRSSHILFATSDQEKAQQVLDDINAGKIGFEDAAKQYSTDKGSAEKGGDVGWDKLNSFVTEYTNALKDLEVGKVSALVKSQYGYHIIKCTDKWTTPDKIESLTGVPKEIVDDARDKKKKSENEEAFKNYLDSYKTSNNINVVIYHIPPGLPYDVPSSTGKTSTSPVTTTK
ncbi:MAG: peptidylprolyl isomerase [Coriobacteriia bacterium]|nr:peptidylprolyl isomerase [Coriobacteriia bacterium]